MKYYAFLKQTGEGCDYTIGCGKNLIEITDVNSMDEAKEKMAKIVEEDYNNPETKLAECLIIEASSFESLNLVSVYVHIEEKKVKELKEEQLKKDKLEYERLKAQFE